jgi:DNA-binding PadR family transcriptional regulator
MIQRLIILGILKKNPSTGYDIKKFIEKELGIFSNIDTHSIYYPLRKMEKEGLVEKREIREAHLKKYIYCITPKGEREFLHLAKDTFLSERRPFIDIDIPLYFLSFLNKQEVLPLLRLRLRFLIKVKRWLLGKKKELREAPKNIQLLLQHHLKLATAEKSFIKEMISAIKQGEM